MKKKQLLGLGGFFGVYFLDGAVAYEGDVASRRKSAVCVWFVRKCGYLISLMTEG